MSTALVEIDRETLRARMERADAPVLVDALPPIAFAASRLPGAINIPPESVDALAERRIPDLETEVVVYCANPELRELGGGRRAPARARLPERLALLGRQGGLA